ncbi:hypothetical protein ACFORG_15350 [Lutimaribacter marinistellae]|uniref:Uncharacterized protein n=1 Tax=Lutimaribacter marinistellae TaxID=1820329 RepID=A0ABV7TJS4_9RHOB
MEQHGRRTYPTREDSSQDLFEFIELFCNLKRQQTNNGTQSPVDFEIIEQKLIKPGICKTRATSASARPDLRKDLECPK